MGSDWQISAAYLSELSRPAFYALSASASACVLASARRHFGPAATAAWAVAAFLLPHVAVPIYLAARLLSRHNREEDKARTEQAPPVKVCTPHENSETGVSASPRLSDEVHASGSQGIGAHPATSEEDAATRAKPLRFRFALPSAYASLLLAAGAIFFIDDYRSADAHLARAQDARLFGRRDHAICEYRAALALDGDAHTHKLLGLEFFEAGRWDEALEEFRAAERKGEPDAALQFHIASALDALGRPAEAVEQYQKFLRGHSCTQTTPDPHCDAAQNRSDALSNNEPRGGRQ